MCASGDVLAAPGFPAAEHHAAALAPVEGFVASEDAMTPSPGCNLGTEVIIAFRFDHQGIAGFHGIRLTYTFGGRGYVPDVPDSFVACTRHPNETIHQATRRCSVHQLTPVGKASPYAP